MRIHTERGDIHILPEVFIAISGFAATNCFGVKGMAARNVQDGLVQMLRRENLARGVKITFGSGGKSVNIELHIIVEHGVNMPALCDSIMSEVRYIVEKTTSVPVSHVDIYIDSVVTEK